MQDRHFEGLALFLLGAGIVLAGCRTAIFARGDRGIAEAAAAWGQLRLPSVKIRRLAGLLVRFATIPNMLQRLASHRRQLLPVNSPPRMDKLWRNFRRSDLACIIHTPRQSPLVNSSPRMDQVRTNRCGFPSRSPLLGKFFRPAGVPRRGQRRSAEFPELA